MTLLPDIPPNPSTTRLDRHDPPVWSPEPRRVWHILTPEPIHHFLGPTEQCRAVTNRHWIVAAKAVIGAAVGAPLAVAVSVLLVYLAPGWWWAQVLLGLGALTHLTVMGYRVLRWRADRVVVTDQRVIWVHGVFTCTIDTRQFAKVTDLTVHQSVLGMILGYGSFRFESAGRHDDGASREVIDFVPDPRGVYQAMLSINQPPPVRFPRRPPVVIDPDLWGRS